MDNIDTNSNLYRINASVEWVSIGSDDGLSPIPPKPLSKPMLGYCQLEP